MLHSVQIRDDYFHLTKSSARKSTSDRTLSKLDAATMDQVCNVPPSSFPSLVFSVHFLWWHTCRSPLRVRPPAHPRNHVQPIIHSRRKVEIAAVLKTFHPALEREQRALVRKQAAKAKMWVSLLAAGFNILCHGFGSKKVRARLHLFTRATKLERASFFCKRCWSLFMFSLVLCKPDATSLCLLLARSYLPPFCTPGAFDAVCV